mmetsp:Transcript_8239/g.9616  ORF Transcript_8239/g.9616 Transcript_8239/m.9616 type:complete len:109 (-) Transcript_8239:151-477(-)
MVFSDHLKDNVSERTYFSSIDLRGGKLSTVGDSNATSRFPSCRNDETRLNKNVRLPSSRLSTLDVEQDESLPASPKSTIYSSPTVLLVYSSSKNIYLTGEFDNVDNVG